MKNEHDFIWLFGLTTMAYQRHITPSGSVYYIRLDHYRVGTATFFMIKDDSLASTLATGTMSMALHLWTETEY